MSGVLRNFQNSFVEAMRRVRTASIKFKLTLPKRTLLLVMFSAGKFGALREECWVPKCAAAQKRLEQEPLFQIIDSPIQFHTQFMFTSIDDGSSGYRNIYHMSLKTFAFAVIFIIGLFWIKLWKSTCFVRFVCFNNNHKRIRANWDLECMARSESRQTAICHFVNIITVPRMLHDAENGSGQIFTLNVGPPAMQ